jgi:nucleoside-diphosphate-sugar epimerase
MAGVQGSAGVHGIVLVTGARGLVGRSVAARLDADGWRVRSFDLVDGDDLRDPDAVDRATAGCRMVVHAGAVPHDSKGTPEEIEAINVGGTGHVMRSAELHGVERVVAFSSIQVFGASECEGPPIYRPIDDDHPRRASRPYGRSKVLNEDLCQEWTARTGHPTMMLRPVEIVDRRRFARLDVARMEYGAFVHVDDVADAVSRALVVAFDGHARLLLSAAGEIDTSRATAVLGWVPQHRRPPRTLRHYVRRLRRR